MITPDVAVANGTTGVTTIQVTLTGVVAGDLIAVDAMIPAGRTLTLTDDRGNTYNIIAGTTQLLSDSSRSIAKYFAIAGASGDTVITYSIDGAGTRVGFAAQKASSDVGWGANPVEDVAAALTDPAGTTSSSGNATSAGAAWYHGGLVGTVQLNATLVGGSGYGDLVENAPGRIATAHKVVASGTTDDFDLNHSSSITGIVLVVFREDAGGGGNTSPDTPTCSADVTGPTTVTLSSSAFADDDVGDTHEGSQWQVDEASGDFSSPVYDSGEEAVDLESHAVTGLTANTDYIARVRHKDDSGDAGTEWSDWSAATATFTTFDSVTITPFVVGVSFGTTFGVSREIEPFVIGVRFNAPTPETPGDSVGITPFGIGVSFIAPTARPTVTIEPFVIGIQLRNIGVQTPDGAEGLKTLNSLSRLTTVVR